MSSSQLAWYEPSTGWTERCGIDGHDSDHEHSTAETGASPGVGDRGAGAGNMGDGRGVDDKDRSLRFVRLFARHEHQIYAYIVSVLSNWADADEVMQETSVALWEMIDDFQEGTSFRHWACRIAYFRILRFRQKRGRDRHEFDHQFVEAVAETALEEADSFESRRMALADCLKRLKREDRELLESCYTGGDQIKHVAERLDRPAKSVYKALGRIRQALFECVRRKVAVEERGR